MTTSPHSLPLSVRLMNLTGEGAGRIGLQPIKLDVGGLLEKAVANTGLTDFGGDEFRQPLALLIESLEKEANWPTAGGDDDATARVRVPCARLARRRDPKACRPPMLRNPFR
jgi:hypothetical protein